MTVEEMARRLGIEDTELDVLRAQEQAQSLPGNYKRLSDYLGARVLEAQNQRWAELLVRLNAKRAQLTSFEAVDQFLADLEAYVKSLESLPV